MKLSSEDVALELKEMIREVQQERTKVHAEWTTAKTNRRPNEGALKAKLEALSKRVEVLKLTLGVSDLDGLVKRAEALKPFMAALEKAAAGSATAAALPPSTSAAGSSGTAAALAVPAPAEVPVAGNLAEAMEGAAAAGGVAP
jgi:hypothetical protein